MQSLSKRSIRHLKEDVLPSEGVRNLISKDEDELLRIVEADKRISRELAPQKQLKEEAKSVMQQLMTLVQYTAELYHELLVLDRFEQYDIVSVMKRIIQKLHQKVMGSIYLRGELKSQRRQVKNLLKKSLWSRNLEEVMEKLVDIMHFLLLEIHCIFGSADNYVPSKALKGRKKLGAAGLSLHYANIILQIDTLVARSSFMPPSLRDSLYQSLPPNIKSALRSKLQSFHVKYKLSVADIKGEMAKTLQWLVPIATNTANSEVNRKPIGLLDVIRIETLHHADNDKTEMYVLEQLVWLHFLVTKKSTNGVGMRSPLNSPNHTYHQNSNEETKRVHSSATPPGLTSEDLEMLQDIFYGLFGSFSRERKMRWKSVKNR